ncbi:unnamed protein product [Owenia fusiformis]|uniref:Uncharacterized protein n=1 Tax=Owenia fusiformis TaxID=6347 RepID=A0A8J1XRW0_OWEFU|nr:unnamed protein product [Owenia fusiformis]
MATDFSPENIRKLLEFGNLEKPVQKHLKNVYSCLAISMMSAAVGAYLTVFMGIMQGGFLTCIISLGLLFWLFSTPHNRENVPKRLGIMGAFALFTGFSLGPILNAVMYIDSSIVPTAFLGTCVIFICFSVCSLLSPNRKWLYLGGSLFSGLSILLLLGLLNLFIGSQLIFELRLYLGLGIMCAFVLYDTQLIVEKCRRGDEDFIWHSIDLFIDFIQIFQKLMIILANKENKKKRRD